MSRPFEARYEGTCAGCSDEIIPGQLIRYDSDERLVHEGHELESTTVLTRTLAAETVCTDCWLVHGGECDR